VITIARLWNTVISFRHMAHIAEHDTRQALLRLRWSLVENASVIPSEARDLQL
jgi:hypothetical protein